jgi:hypothetical protein
VFPVRRPDKWTLADVLDFEALVAADERAPDPAAVAARDARLWNEQIAPQLSAEEATDRQVVFHRWVEARRHESEALPGKWFTTAWHWLTGTALICGLALGFVVASGALYYAGTRPVNVAVFLAVTVGVQWILLLWTLGVMLSGGVRAASQRLLVRAGESIGQALASAAGNFSGDKRLRLRAELATLRRLAGRNLQALGWAPLVSLQQFGVWWNLGVLAALLARVLFTDVGFGWESTVANSPDGMYALVHFLALPWATFAPNVCPTLQQVERSWFHYQSGVAALDRTAMASWWPWLVMVIGTYGLMPRAILRFYFQLRLAFSIRKVSFNEPRHRLAWQRLTGPVIRSDQPSSAEVHSDGTLIQPANAQVDSLCLFVASPLAAARAEIEQWVIRQFRCRVAMAEIVEVDFPSANETALARLQAASAEAPAWMVAVPAPFTAFAAFTQFLARMSEIAGSRGFVLVVALDDHGKPVPPDAGWSRYWNDFMRAEAGDCAIVSFTP